MNFSLNYPLIFEIISSVALVLIFLALIGGIFFYILMLFSKM